MKKLFFLIPILCFSCLSGCHVTLDPASKVFGDASTAPKLKVKKTWTGFSAEASTDFAGTLDAQYHPDTGEISLKGAIASTANTVLDKYPEWIKSMETANLARIDANIKINEMQLEKYKATADVARALGEAGIGVVGEMVKTLGGSTVDVSTPFGGVSGMIGVPAAVAPTAGTMTTTAITGAAPPVVAPANPIVPPPGG